MLIEVDGHGIDSCIGDVSGYRQPFMNQKFEVRFLKLQEAKLNLNQEDFPWSHILAPTSVLGLAFLVRCRSSFGLNGAISEPQLFGSLRCLAFATKNS